MKNYEIYLPFWLNQNSQILIKELSERTGETLKVSLHQSEIKSSDNNDKGYFLIIEGLESRDKYKNYLEKLFLGLYCSCLKLGITPRPRYGLGYTTFFSKEYLEKESEYIREQHFKRTAKRINAMCIDSGHPAIFPSDTELHLLPNPDITVTSPVSKDSAEFTQFFLDYIEAIDLEAEANEDKRLLIAIELYHFCFYKYRYSPSAKYVSLMTVLEILSNRKEWSEKVKQIEKDAVVLKRELVQKEKKKLEDRFSKEWCSEMEEYKELINYENSIQITPQQSITSAVRDLVCKALEESSHPRAKELINSIPILYRRRSKIVHENSRDFEGNLDLDIIVREVLLHQIKCYLNQ